MPLAPKTLKLAVKVSAPFAIEVVKAEWPAADDALTAEAMLTPALFAVDVAKSAACPVNEPPLFGSNTRKLE